VELAHASAHTNIKSPKLLAFGDGNKTQILAKHVDVIDWRNNKTHFKFAWKIQRSVQRIFMFGRLLRWSVVPGFCVGSCFWNEMLTGLHGQPFNDLLHVR